MLNSHMQPVTTVSGGTEQNTSIVAALGRLVLSL